MTDVEFVGKRFREPYAKEKLDYFKRTVLPKMFRSINREYYEQKVNDLGISLQTWRHLNLCHCRLANKEGGRWRAGMPVWFKDSTWGCPAFKDFHS